MSTIQPNRFLRNALRADAAVSGAVGVLQLALADLLAKVLELPSLMLTGAGLFLLGYVALLVVLARSARLWSGWIWIVILGNIAWALGCITLAFSREFAPSELGIAFLATQTVTVIVFAALEYRGLVGSERPIRAALAL